MSVKEQLFKLNKELPSNVTLVAVSKTYPPETIMEAYEAGQRIFGENKPQEMVAKWQTLPKDIEWHMIGHLQTNKVKYIAPFVSLIHSVDSEKLLGVINSEAIKNNRIIDILFEIHVAKEESKHGWNPEDLNSFIRDMKVTDYPGIRFRGVMGIATFTDDVSVIEQEFSTLESYFKEYRTIFGNDFDTLSMGMSGDYNLAVKHGSTMVRIGSMIFGARNYNN